MVLYGNQRNSCDQLVNREFAFGTLHSQGHTAKSALILLVVGLGQCAT